MKWLARVGDRVNVGDPLVEIETEKAVFVIDAERAGVLRAIHVDEGCRAAVGTAIGVFTHSGDEAIAVSVPDQAKTAAPECGVDVSAPAAPLLDDYAAVEYGDALLG